MKLFDTVASRIRALITRSQPETSRVIHMGTTTSGTFITPETAMRQAVVWACLSYLSRTVAQLPWRVLVDAPTTREVASSAVHRLLRVRPNPEMSPFSFKELMVWCAASRGNAVAEIEWNNRNEPVALWPLEPDRIRYVRHPKTGELLYECWTGSGGYTYLEPSQVFHLRGYGHGPVGLDVVAYAAESIGWARATEIFGARYFGQGVNPSGVLAMHGKLTPEGKKVLEEEMAAKWAGNANAHKTILLDMPADYKRIAPDPETAQLIETRQHQVEEICRWFGVPPHKVMHLLRSTFSNIEHQSIEVVVDSITPWCLRLEEEADYKLFGTNRAGLYTKLDLKGLLRGDYKSRQEGLQIMRRNGVINADRWAELEDMVPPGKANGGDKYIVEGNMVEVNKLGQAESPPESPPDDPVGNIVETARQQRALAERLH